MHVKGVLVLVLALVMGGVSVKLVNSYLDDQVSERKAAAETDTSYIVVADKDLEFGDHVDEDAVRLVELDRSLSPDDAFTSIQQVVGDAPAIALTSIRENEVILPHKLSPHGARGGMPAKIPEDMRAMTISVNEVKGVAGFVLPGDFVDILHTTDVGRKDKNLVTRVVAQNVNVLGVDQISSYDEDEPRVVNAVTLLVSQRDGQRLTLAQQLGDLNLLLRNEFDGSILEDDVVAYNDLMTVETGRKPVVRTRYRRPSVQVIRGLEVKKQQVSEAKPVLPTAATAAGGNTVEKESGEGS